MFSLKIEGVDDLLNKYQQATDALAEQVKVAVRETAETMADNARQNCTGKLKDSITVDIADDGMSAVISADHSDAVSTEYGTKSPKIHAKPAKGHEAPAKPFMNPAFEENAQRLLDTLSDITGQ
jgi:phage gpG-like protein